VLLALDKLDWLVEEVLDRELWLVELALDSED